MEGKYPRIVDLFMLGALVLGLHVLLNRLLPRILLLIPKLI